MSSRSRKGRAAKNACRRYWICLSTFPLLISPARRAGARCEVVMAGEVEQAGMKLHGRRARSSTALRRLSYTRFAGGASQRLKGVDVPPQEALHGLVEGEQRGQRARVAEDHDESGDRACALSDVDLAERAPVDLCLLPDQSHDPAVDGAAGLGPQAPHEAADREDRAGIAALADHLVDPRGAQPRVLRQGVADERQIRVEDAGPTQAGTDPAVSRSTAARTVSRWRPSWAAMVPTFQCSP